MEKKTIVLLAILLTVIIALLLKYSLQLKHIFLIKLNA